MSCRSYATLDLSLHNRVIGRQLVIRQLSLVYFNKVIQISEKKRITVGLISQLDKSDLITPQTNMNTMTTMLSAVNNLFKRVDSLTPITLKTKNLFLLKIKLKNSFETTIAFTVISKGYFKVIFKNSKSSENFPWSHTDPKSFLVCNLDRNRKFSLNNIVTF